MRRRVPLVEAIDADPFADLPALDLREAHARVSHVRLVAEPAEDDDTQAAIRELIERGAMHGDALMERGSEPLAFAVDGLIPERSIAILQGAEKSYKSTLALALVLARLCGGTWLGRAVTQAPGPALILSPDFPAADVARTLAALAPSFGTTLAAVRDRIVVLDRTVELVPVEERDRLAHHARVARLSTAQRHFDQATRDNMLKDRDAVDRAAIENVAPHLDDLETIEQGRWSIVVGDVAGDLLPAGLTEDRGEAARMVAQTCRGFAANGAIVLMLKHTKHGARTDARAGKGATEWGGKFDVICTIAPASKDSSRVIHVTMRHRRAPAPIRIEPRGDAEAIRSIECTTTTDDATTRTTGQVVDVAEVLAALRAQPTDDLTLGRVREIVAKARGQKSGSKSGEATTKRALAQLVEDSEATTTTKQRNGKAIETWRWSGGEP